jgi:putative hydrolase of the HAD superfamily
VSRRFDDIEVVFLDVGDTLIRAHPSWAAVYASVFPEFGIEASLEDLERALSVGAPEWDLEGPFEASEAASWERIRAFDGAVLAQLGYPDLSDDLFHAIERAFAERASWQVFDDVVPAIAALDSAGYRLCVISNWLWGAPELLHTLDLAHHFEHLVISARVGYNKPAPAIFEHALQVMDVAPHRAVHVGDQHRADVLGARAVGIHPVRIDRGALDPGHHHAGPADDDAPVIRDLFELLDLLGVGRPAVVRA